MHVILRGNLDPRELKSNKTSMGGESEFHLSSELYEISVGTSPPLPPPTIVTKDTFAIEKEYLITSADGSRFLMATDRKSGRGREFKRENRGLQLTLQVPIIQCSCSSSPGKAPVSTTTDQSGAYGKNIQEMVQSLANISIPSEEDPGIGGYSLDFKRMDMATTGPPPAAARFIFSGRVPDKLRLHSTMHNNFMCYFLGAHEPREWVVWHTAVPTHGEWEVMTLEWIPKEEGGKEEGLFKIRGHNGQYVKWVVQGFASTHDYRDASVFKLMEA